MFFIIQQFIELSQRNSVNTMIKFSQLFYAKIIEILYVIQTKFFVSTTGIPVLFQYYI